MLVLHGIFTTFHRSTSAFRSASSLVREELSSLAHPLIFPAFFALIFARSSLTPSAPRPDGSIVLGASRGSWPAEMQAANLGSVDDSRWHPVVAYGAMKGWSGLHPKGGWAAESAAEAQSNSEAQPKATGEAKTGKEEEEAEAAPSKPLAPLDPTTAPQHLRALATAAATPGTKDEADDNGTLGLEYAWTGIIGFTPDMVPLVGELPGKEGQFVAAGYCGHGKCGEAAGRAANVVEVETERRGLGGGVGEGIQQRHAREWAR